MRQSIYLLPVLLFLVFVFAVCKKQLQAPPANPPTGSPTPLPDTLHIPTIITDTAKSITLHSAISGGTIKSNGGSAILATGIVWSLHQKPDTSLHSKIMNTGNLNSGSFVSNITGLTPGILYYAVAFAINKKGIAYGNEISFRTVTINTLLTTSQATIITAHSCISGGTIATNGDSITSRGVCYNKTGNPTIVDTKTTDSAGTGSFISRLTNLSAHTVYYIKSYAVALTGNVYYGNEVAFTTSIVPAYKANICFSPYLDGQSPDYRSQINKFQITNLLQEVAPYTLDARIYGLGDGLENIPEIARSFGLNVSAGAWLSGDLAENQQQINTLISLGKAGKIKIAVVGNEVLLRGDMTKAQLVAYIQQVKRALPNIPVTTADVYQTFLSHPDLINEVDVIYIHVHPYWEGLPVNCATNFVDNVYNRVKAVSHGKQVVIAETGWPSSGNTLGYAVPSPTNSADYFIRFISWARSKQVKYFYFSAFDESWKIAHEGNAGGSWGIWNKNGGDMKTAMQRVFDGETAIDNWVIDKASLLSVPPSIAFTSIPVTGSDLNLYGIAKGVLPSDYSVVTYIYVNGWWIKPTLDEPKTTIQCDGSFICDITTGGNDNQATKIKAFVIPSSFSPPLLTGEAALPVNLEQIAVASFEIQR